LALYLILLLIAANEICIMELSQLSMKQIDYLKKKKKKKEERKKEKSSVIRGSKFCSQHSHGVVCCGKILKNAFF